MALRATAQEAAKPASSLGLGVLALVMLGLAPGAVAETSLLGMKVEGEADIGGRFWLEEPSARGKAKLEEYRDLGQEPFGDFHLRFSTPDDSYAIGLGGDKMGQEDQSYFLTTGRLGLWDFDFGWDQIPHILGTTPRLIPTEPATGVFRLPTPRPSLPTYNLGLNQEPQDISVRWDVAKFSIALTPTPDLDLNADFTWIQRHGNRPFGAAMGSPGNNFIEILRPIEDSIYDLRLKASYVGEGWQVQGGYTLSLYQNSLNSVTADNPCFGLSAPITAGGCAGDATNAPATARVSLAPDNMANTLWLAGGVNLPMRTRITGNFAYSLRTQDDAFLPSTVNPALASSPQLTLPRQSLDGSAYTILFNLNATSRPLPPLTLTARYRLFDLDDTTNDITIPTHVVNDRTPIVQEPILSFRPSYIKQNADLDGKWRFGRPLALTLGVGWERWDRSDFREASTTNEYFAKLKLDWTPWDWMVGHLTYQPSFRRISGYNTFAFRTHTGDHDLEDLIASDQSLLLRKFDEANRDSQRVALLMDLTPTDVVTISPNATYRYDDYYDSTLGLQKVETWSAGVDLSWRPLEWLPLFAGYLYESSDQKQASRYREPNVDFVDFTWISSNVDTSSTVYAGFRAALIPKLLDWNVRLSYAVGHGEINTFNPIPPTSGTASQRTNATAQPFPDQKNNLLRIQSDIRYIWKAWTMTLSYLFEKWDQANFHTDGLTPFVGDVSSIWLGNSPQNYTAQILALTVGYRFK